MSDAILRAVLSALGFAIVSAAWASIPPAGLHGRRTPNRDRADWAATGGLSLASTITAIVMSGPAMIGDSGLDAGARGVFAGALGLIGAIAPPHVLAAGFAVLAIGLRS